MTDLTILRADRFAGDAHATVAQVRKYTGEPYILHPRAVAELVRSVPHSSEMIAAALLHDTVEDTNATHEDIQREFGPLVGFYVWCLTDRSTPEDGNRAARKEIDRIHLSKAPAEVKTIKLADLIHNTSTIVEHDKDFARVYLKEKALLLPVLIAGDPALFVKAHTLLIESETALIQHELGRMK